MCFVTRRCYCLATILSGVTSLSFLLRTFSCLDLRKLISTSYAPESKKYKMPYQPTLFETSQPHYNVDMSKTNGKIFVLERDITGDNRIDIKPSIIKKQEIIWKFQNIFLSLQRERWNQVEPRCAERWHLCDDEQFDLAAWFYKHSDHHSIEWWSFFIFGVGQVSWHRGCRRFYG